jgi:hypothetical protein
VSQFLKSQSGPADSLKSKKDLQHYIDRYEKDPDYKEWFDTNFPGHSIYEIIGLPKNEDIEETANNSENVTEWINTKKESQKKTNLVNNTTSRFSADELARERLADYATRRRLHELLEVGFNPTKKLEIKSEINLPDNATEWIQSMGFKPFSEEQIVTKRIQEMLADPAIPKDYKRMLRKHIEKKRKQHQRIIKFYKNRFAEGPVSDEEFVSGILYLVSNDIINVK